MINRLSMILAAALVALVLGCRVTARAPAMIFETSDGIGNLLLFKESADHREFLVVRASKARLALTTGPRTFDLACPPDGLDVEIHVFAEPAREGRYTSDVVIESEEQPVVWRAIRGTLTIQLAAPSSDDATEYWASGRIDSAEFQSGDGRTIQQSKPLEVQALVGWSQA